ncbi:MAG: SMI1/KNR4 family protein [Nodosilinea sp.]
MGAFDWEVFLRRWSQAILESMDGSDRQLLPPEVIESGWLGYPGASEADLQRAEIRLGMRLPPSYRAFLKVSNGWRQTAKQSDGFNHRLWSTEAIDRFAVRHPQWIKSFTQDPQLPGMHLEDDLNQLDDSWQPMGITDEEYYVYGDAQDPTKFRVEYLHTAIAISDVGLDSIYLLNPQVVTAEGEWESWFLADYLAGADRYPSFQAMMEAEYQNFLDWQKPLPEGTSTPKAGQSAAEVGEPTPPPLPSPPLDPPTGLPHPPVNYPDLDSAEPEATGPSPKSEEIPWQRLKYLAIEVQARQPQAKPEYRTLVRHADDLTAEVWSGLPDQKVQQWLRRHLKATKKIPLPHPCSSTVPEAVPTALLPEIAAEPHQEDPNPQPPSVDPPPLPPPPPVPLALELEQLVIGDPAYPAQSIVVNPLTHRQPKYLKLGSLVGDQPFTIEVAFRLPGDRLDHPGLDQVLYNVQVFAQNRASSQWLKLGETSPSSLAPGRQSYRTTLFNQTLDTGMYRLQVLTRFSGAAQALASFELPLLNVI